jgi:hypothetical protein
MAPVVVYRVEHETRPNTRRSILSNCFDGPFSQFGPLNTNYVKRYRHSKVWQMPVPSVDGIDGFHSTAELCGCININHIYEWFNDVMRVLFKNGYCVRVYMVPAGAVRFGETQVLFDHRSMIPAGLAADWYLIHPTGRGVHR